MTLKPAISTLISYRGRDEKLVKVIESCEYVKNWEIIDEGFHKLNNKLIKSLVELSSTRKIRYAVHAPFSSINLAEVDQNLCRCFIRFMLASLKKAYKIEASTWVVHPGRFTPFSYFFPEECWKAHLASLNLLAKEASNLGIQVVVENMVGDFALFLTIDDGVKIVDNVDCVGICLDTGHAHIVGSLEEFLDKLPKIKHVHVHDNRGEKDEHLAAYDGNINWNVFLEKLKTTGYDGWIVAENYHLSDAIKTLKRLGLLEEKV